MKKISNKKIMLYGFFAVAGLTTLYLYTHNSPKMEEKQKKQTTFDKVVFGLLIGGAIGSVLGLAIAPDKGKTIREKIQKKSSDLIDKNEDIIAVVGKRSKGILALVGKLLKKDKAGKGHDILSWLEEMTAIPTESKEVQK